MSNETIKSEGPACACGRGDIYMEGLLLKEKEKSASANHKTENLEVGNSSSGYCSGSKD